MKLRFLFFAFLIFYNTFVFSQNQINVEAAFDVPNKRIHISQSISYKNTTNDTLKIIYLNDWNNAYSSKTTPLAKRFTEEFNSKFHFAKDKARGFTTINTITDDKTAPVSYSRLKAHPDILKVELNKVILPQQYYTLDLDYTLNVPDDTFTNYGVNDSSDFILKYWYITPAIYNGKWQYYSNKNLNDLYTPKTDISLKVQYPRNYYLMSELNTLNLAQTDTTQTITLYGKDRINTNLSIRRFPNYNYIKTDNVTVISNIEDDGITPPQRAIITDRIISFINKNIGNYPHERFLITENDYKNDPLYGLNQLPGFLRPFPDDFQFEMKLLKTALNNYLENTLLLNPRKDYWLKDGLQIYFLMKYVDEHYPDMKLLGTLGNIWGIRAFHAADLDYNDQFNLFYMQMVRTNQDQPLTTSKDSLLKFNASIAGKYKAGIGLKYLDDFINADVLEKTISQYLNATKLQTTSSLEFENLLKQNTSKDVDWFFTEYINTREKADFKIKKIKKTQDSITLSIKNKRQNSFPVSLYTFNDDLFISKTWIENIKENKTITIPRNYANKLVLNYENNIPEINLRDNWKSLKGLFFNNKPLQFRLFKDIEDPNYNQVFLMPLVQFRNIYDGLTLGVKAYNKTLLRKRLSYNIAPQYALNSKALTGSASAYYTHNIEGRDLYNLSYGMKFSYLSFDEDAFVTKIVPNLTLNFRNNDDFRSNKSQFLNVRYLDISRDTNQNPNIVLNDPNYGVFNLRYINSNPGLVNYSRWFSDFQISKTFGKLAFNYEYRKLFENNRKINVRFFAGTFLYNNNDINSDYFSFALDRPTDYLFDYDYLGRSEDSGIFSQQIIIAEGGFKSKLQPSFANQWMSTLNVSTTLWKYIEAYGDMGFVKNKFNNAQFVYDSGIRLDLVTDYFELYFPIYSNLGWEIAQSNYDQKIRFKFTVDPQVLLGLFRRKWY